MWKRALDRAGVSDARLRRDFTEQRRAVRRYRPAEYAAARLLLPEALLPHVVAAVAFMHETDDRVDRGSRDDGDDRVAAWADWDGHVRKALDGADPELPVLRCLVHTTEHRPALRGHVEEFLRGSEREAEWTAFADDAELARYVRAYSLPALMLTAGLIAPEDPARRAAYTDACHRLIAGMQRLDFLEDLSEDVREGRPGIPADAVARHGADLTRPDAALGRLVAEQADRAAAEMPGTEVLEAAVDPEYRPFVRALVGVQRLRLDAVRRAGASLATRSSGPARPAAAGLLLGEWRSRRRGLQRPR
ncbi:squalene/phytoene synthase family protein [Streptomyces sp. HUAS MG47]|uniref:squalene/phytoene synthase family protein n=1 Tax=Streptomyces solicamelliae TaxID=3231716 RepID=UPI003877F058